MNYSIYINVKGVWILVSEFTDNDKTIARDLIWYVKQFMSGARPDIDGIKLEKAPF